MVGIINGGIGDDTLLLLTFGASRVNIKEVEVPGIKDCDDVWRLEIEELSLLLLLLFDMSIGSPPIKQE